MRVPARTRAGMIARMSDTDDATSDSSDTPTPRERRIAAWRAAPRVLARLGFLAPLRERLALLDAAGGVYDLDETSDIYGLSLIHI